MKTMRPFFSMFTLLSNHFELIQQITFREILGRYRGSWLGLMWSFFNPLLMLLVYTFVFGTVLKVKWMDANLSGFAMFMFCGLLLHTLFSECVNRSTTLIIENQNYVKKIVFPLAILPWVTLFSALFHALISLLVLVLFQWLVNGGITFQVLLIPIVLLPYALLLLGLSYFISALGVYLRDISQVMSVLTSALLFLSPVFYPITSLPKILQTYYFLNPLAVIIKEIRVIVIEGGSPDWGVWLIYCVVAYGVAVSGYYFFIKAKNGFADVL